jgi:hypothetical protein
VRSSPASSRRQSRERGVARHGRVAHELSRAGGGARRGR